MKNLPRIVREPQLITRRLVILQEPILFQSESECKCAKDVFLDFPTFLITPLELTHMKPTQREHTHPIECQTRFLESWKDALGKPDVWHNIVVLLPDFEGLFHAWRRNDN